MFRDVIRTRTGIPTDHQVAGSLPVPARTASCRYSTQMAPTTSDAEGKPACDNPTTKLSSEFGMGRKQTPSRDCQANAQYVPETTVCVTLTGWLLEERCPPVTKGNPSIRLKPGAVVPDLSGPIATGLCLSARYCPTSGGPGEAVESHLVLRVKPVQIHLVKACPAGGP